MVVLVILLKIVVNRLKKRFVNYDIWEAVITLLISCTVKHELLLKCVF